MGIKKRLDAIEEQRQIAEKAKEKKKENLTKITDVIKSFLESRGFSIEKHTDGMETSDKDGLASFILESFPNYLNNNNEKSIEVNIDYLSKNDDFKSHTKELRELCSAILENKWKAIEDILKMQPNIDAATSKTGEQAIENQKTV